MWLCCCCLWFCCCCECDFNCHCCCDCGDGDGGDAGVWVYFCLWKKRFWAFLNIILYLYYGCMMSDDIQMMFWCLYNIYMLFIKYNIMWNSLENIVCCRISIHWLKNSKENIYKHKIKYRCKIDCSMFFCYQNSWFFFVLSKRKILWTVSKKHTNFI